MYYSAETIQQLKKEIADAWLKAGIPLPDVETCKKWVETKATKQEIVDMHQSYVSANTDVSALKTFVANLCTPQLIQEMDTGRHYRNWLKNDFFTLPHNFNPVEKQVIKAFADRSSLESVHKLYEQVVGKEHNPQSLRGVCYTVEAAPLDGAESLPHVLLTAEMVEAFDCQQFYIDGVELLVANLEETIPADKRRTPGQIGTFNDQVSRLSTPEIIQLYDQLYKENKSIVVAENKASKQGTATGWYAFTAAVCATLTFVTNTFLPKAVTQNCTLIREPSVEFKSFKSGEKLPDELPQPPGVDVEVDVHTSGPDYLHATVLKLTTLQTLRSTEILGIPIEKRAIPTFEACEANLHTMATIPSQAGKKNTKFSDVLELRSQGDYSPALREKNHPLKDKYTVNDNDNTIHRSVTSLGTFQKTRDQSTIPLATIAVATLGLAFQSAASARGSLKRQQKETAATLTGIQNMASLGAGTAPAVNIKAADLQGMFIRQDGKELL
ncbi:MAG: hypothetical protein LW855_07760 [Alphaproteobacteria bacterium]|nr:hypothetical protein [Alphaproteobacteria bacterium]